MKSYSLVGKKLIECAPDELLETPVGMIVDDQEEMIRLILTPDARKTQRELLIQQSAEFNKKEYAGTYLVSHIENPGLVKVFLEEMKQIQEGKEEKEKASKKTKKKTKKKKEPIEEVESEIHILERWDPDLVKKLVNYLDGKPHANLTDIQEYLEVTEGEAYWLTQDLIYVGTLPGRWIGYDDGRWVYQIISDQPLSKQKKKKTIESTTAKKTTKTSTTKDKKKTEKKT